MLILGKSDIFEKMCFNVFWTIILDPILLQCSGRPWDPFRFPATHVIWLVCFKSDSTFSRTSGFPDYCMFAKFHHAQGVSQPCATVLQLPVALW